MKIVRFLDKDAARYGRLENSGIRPCDGDPFTGLTPAGDIIPLETARLLAPVDPPNVLCLGLNYRRHASEARMELPERPLLFIKPTTTVCGPHDDIVVPPHTPEQLDWEVELVMVIGRRAKNVPESKALDYVIGYTAANDVSNRGAQFADGQWARGKSYDTFCPIGPALVTDLDPGALDLSCRVNGRVVQSSSTADMIFPPAYIVSFLSSCMTLLPGTLILTGTPEGVGYTRNPPEFLKPGDVVECEIEGIGTIRNPVIDGSA